MPLHRWPSRRACRDMNRQESRDADAVVAKLHQTSVALAPRQVSGSNSKHSSHHISNSSSSSSSSNSTSSRVDRFLVALALRVNLTHRLRPYHHW